ncbi:MAG: dTMP kinase [Collinsella intestinalis]|uniref:Thymidylate kinase n=1 Tax=Collinsella intestinalis TaxID=147207 RepID=A0A6N3CS57_9ACTN|nr:dTMP kinase [Collinsella intestinalis]
MSSRGLFITVEGIDGCGKSTQARLIAAALEAAGHDVLRLREPGGVKISEQIREILLDPANAEMGDVCELLLYEAARAQLVHQVIRPALAAGKTVVCDRFYDSTTAYQAFADGLDRNMVSQANELAVDGCRPDLTLVFDLPVEDALRRRSGREAEDRLELKGLEFQERVAAGFRAVAADEPDRVKLIDAGESIAEVFSGVAAELRSAGLSMSEDDAAAALQTCQGKC